MRIFKKASGQASVTWEDCVVVAIAWGWIDGQCKSLDETSFLQRLTPRRARSNWSQKQSLKFAAGGRAVQTLVVASRTIIRTLMKQAWLRIVPALHSLHWGFALQSRLG